MTRSLARIKAESDDGRAFFGEILEQAPVFTEVIFEEIDYYDELLGHLVMARITDEAQRLCRDDPDEADIDRLLAVLERWSAAHPNDDYVGNVIGVSFIEHLQPPEAYRELRTRLQTYRTLAKDLNTYFPG